RPCYCSARKTLENIPRKHFQKGRREMTKQLPERFINSSLSHGTHRTIDLYDAFMSFLQEHDPETAEKIKTQFTDIIQELEIVIESQRSDAQKNGMVSIYEYVQDEEFLIADLFDALDAIAPEGSYFGAHPGDGSDFGFWQHE